MDIKWTSTDVVRIGEIGTPFAPVILWIGVMPASLCRDDGLAVAFTCKELLLEHNITDVDVEIRESVVTRSTSPGGKLLTPFCSYAFDGTVDVREPLTPTLGLPIYSQSMPGTQGTGGFFIQVAVDEDQENANSLFLITARHVVFPQDDNRQFENNKCDSRPRRNIMLFDDAAFDRYLEAIQAEIEHHAFEVPYEEERIKAVEGRYDSEAIRERQHAQAKLEETKEAIKQLNDLYLDIKARWATTESRVIGHVVLSPPINVGAEGHNEDWAVIAIDTARIDASNVEGNVINLGTRIPLEKLIPMMSPNPNDLCSPHSFNYPRDRLLRLGGIIQDDELWNPSVLDQNNDPCLMVLKRGTGTGLTVGRANDVFSYARSYYHGKVETTKEWAILPFDLDSGPFSDEGDSGFVIVDGRGRMGGLLTGGTSASSSSATDITYATPINFLLRRVQDNGLLMPSINPVLAA